jgi:hypothetical protein
VSAADATPPPSEPRWRPWLAWLRHWGISLASLIGGLLTLCVFRRELTHTTWIIGSVLLVWLTIAVLTQVRQTLEERARFVITAADYLVQTLYHGVLLFLLPVYYTSATLDSANAIFVGLLVALALLATFDPWYRVLVHPRPWAGYLFFLVSMFGALNLALPLIGVPPHVALLTAAWAAVMAMTPVACRAWGWNWRRGLELMAVFGVGVAALVYALRSVIPPVPLFVARAAVAWDVGGLDAVEPVAGPIRVDELRERGLVAYTAIVAPAELRQAVQHVWRRDGQVVDVVPLSPVRGGRREGYRTYSRKTAFPEHLAGRWVVDVVTRTGQLIGRLRFRVVP